MAAKIKDGLFIGDAETSQSEVFINDNKISNLINLAGREVHNVWASHGLVYLTYYWEDRPDYKLFTSHEDALLTDIVEFIDVSISHGISVLLFSRNGTGRCVVAACLYLMMKYRWGFEKTYDYVYSKKPDIDLNKGFIQQMFALDMKLLAARQKANAIKYGMENHFKIEANMTINDISAMLPPLEAKRWNAWDPDYVLESAEAGRGMDGESKGEGGSGRYKDSKAEFKRGDSRRSSPGSAAGRPGNNTVALAGPGTGEDDELILIYSFLNSKNTITTLPGPYLDVYETHKNFKLKFNPICFEEDVNWFPSAGVNAARGALKGARAKHAAMLSTAQPKTYSTAPSSAAENKRTADAKFSDSHASSSNGAYTPTPKSVVALENIAPMYIINSQRESRDRGLAEGHSSSTSRDGAGTSAQHYYSHPTMTSAPGDNHYSNEQDSPPTSAQPSPTHTSSSNNPGGMSRQGSNLSVASSSSQQAPFSSDLYEFVGISTEQGVKSKSSREGPQRTWGPRDSIAVQRDHIGGGSSASSRAGPEDYKEESQEEQRRQQARGNLPSYTASSNANSRAAGPSASSGSQQQQLSAEDRLRNLMADMQRHKPSSGSASAQQSAGPSSHHSRSSDRDRSDPRSEPAGPSLYELATMQIGPNSRQPSGSGYERERDSHQGQGQGQGYIEDVEDEELSDPLSAFQRQQGQQQYSGSRGPSSSGGAVRARHDIITHSGRPGSTPTTAGPGSRSSTGAPVPGPRSAWASGTGPITGPGGSRGTSPSSSRPASPSPGAAGPGSRSASPVGKKLVGGAGGTGSVSSNLSVNSINSNGSNQVVGSGTTSGSRVYRHGSPAPNTRPSASSGGSGLGVRGSGVPGPAASGSYNTPTAPTSNISRQHVLASSGTAGRTTRDSLQASGSIANSSVSSLGSGIVGANAYTTARYPSGGAPGVDPSARPSSGSGTRYASPSSAQQAQQQQGRPRSSNASAASLYSAEALDASNAASRMRRAVNSSPLRGSTGSGVGAPAPGPSASTGTPKRYSTPTPQAQPHHDFDSTASAGSTGSARVPLARSGTPTRATWKF